jgi:hypothetical protein
VEEFKSIHREKEALRAQKPVSDLLDLIKKRERDLEGLRRKTETLKSKV